MIGETTLLIRLLRYGSTLSLVVACLGICGHPAVAQSSSHTQASAHMPQGAFLRQPSPGVTSLVQQVKSDPTVAVRYARLFHLPVKMVPVAFSQLRLKPLTEDHVLQVHYVSTKENTGEKLVYKPRRVKRGTYVYCLPDGTPLLIRVCGNPIRSRVSPELYTAIPVPDFTPGESLLQPLPGSSFTGNVPPDRGFVPPSVPLPVISVVLAENVLAPTELPLVPPSLTPAQAKTESLVPPYQWVHGASGLSGLAGLSPLALLPFVHFGGGSGPVPVLNAAAPINTVTPLTPQTPGTPGTPGVPITPQSPPPGIALTPEPGTLAFAMTLLLGAGWLSGRRRK